MSGQRVDGNDFAAVFSVLSEAVARARAGSGPSLIEAHTYRMQAHTNADDDTRYREREEVQSWICRDPLTRLQSHLREAGVLDDEAEERFAAEAELVAAELREAMNREVSVHPSEPVSYTHLDVYKRQLVCVAEHAADLGWLPSKLLSQGCDGDAVCFGQFDGAAKERRNFAGKLVDGLGCDHALL